MMEKIPEFLAAFVISQPAAFVDHWWIIFGALAWFMIMGFATWATFSSSIRDTVMERIALAVIAITAASRGFFIVERGEVPLDGVLAPMAIAFYCVVIWYKHRFIIPRRKGRWGTTDRRSQRKV
jgi:hypothetical protein